ncbi:MAG: hypothetical protein ACLVKE_15210 [Clostridium baratii]
MKTIYSTIALIVLIYFSQNILAQDSKVIYRDDNLSGKLEMLKSDFIKGGAYIWNINVPKGFPVKISRTNNLYIDNVEIYVDDKLNDILTYHHGATEYSDIIYSSGGKITVKMKP